MAWLKSLIGDDQIILVGHSNGGRLGLNFSSRYPGSVKRLILIDSAGLPRTELSYRLKRGLFRSLAKLGKPLSSIKPLRRFLYKLAGASDYHNADPLARITMTGLLRSDAELDLSAVTVPVSIIWGEGDTTTPLKDAYALAKRLPQAESPVIIKGARHSPQFTHTQEVADYILKVVNK
jgi:pimeloyl-ACP methyl ester carboxylesterase